MGQGIGRGAVKSLSRLILFYRISCEDIKGDLRFFHLIVATTSLTRASQSDLRALKSIVGICILFRMISQLSDQNSRNTRFSSSKVCRGSMTASPYLSQIFEYSLAMCSSVRYLLMIERSVACSIVPSFISLFVERSDFFLPRKSSVRILAHVRRPYLLTKE